jgi:ABC-type transport system involved in multi-copper enzyme maturation permease subunit
MFWQKAWLDTRVRFAIGLAVLTLVAWLVVITYPRISFGTGAIPAPNHARYVGFVRDAWFLQGLPQLWCLFAILLANGGLVSQASRGGATFTLALPISRARIVMTRVFVAMGELYLLALLPSLALVLFSPAVHQWYGPGDALVHSLWLFAGGSIFFAVPFFLSSITSQFWVPVAVMLSTACIITVARSINPELAAYTMAPLLGARAYFNHTPLPVMALVDTVAISLALIAVAVRNIARRDF